MSRIKNIRVKRAFGHLMSLALMAMLFVGQWSPASAASGVVMTWGRGTRTPVPVAFPSGVTPISISASNVGTAMAITNDGLYTWSGGSTASAPGKFIFPAAVTQIYAVSGRMSHTLALTNDGLYAWGGNHAGELGDGTTIYRNSTAAKVIFPAAVTSVTAIAAGYYHSLAITNDGLYAWGDNWNGEVGDGTRTNRLLPVKVVFPAAVTTVTAIAASANTSYALTNDGAYAWGADGAGQLGNGSFGILPDGTVDVGQTLPVKVLFNTGTKGKTTTTVTSVTAITAGEGYALAITNDGLYAWGENLAGSLGNGTTTKSAYPVKVLFNVKTNSKDKTPPAVTSIYAIAAGRITSFAITNDGLYAWGLNTSGELGLGASDTSNYKLIPTKVPGEDAATAVAAGEYFTIDLH